MTFGSFGFEDDDSQDETTTDCCAFMEKAPQHLNRASASIEQGRGSRARLRSQLGLRSRGGPAHREAMLVS